VTSASAQPQAPDVGASSERQLALLFACFDGRKTAGKARRSMESQLEAQGDVRLNTSVLEVDAKHKASIHDPHKVLLGTVTVAIVWGLCGLTGVEGVWSVIFWGAVGAIGGVAFLYYYMHHQTKSELGRLGSALPGQSSVLAIWAETKDAARLLQAAAPAKPFVGSAASIGSDLTTRVLADPANPAVVPHGSADEIRKSDTLLSLVLLRYPSPEVAEQMVSQPPADSSFEVSTIIRSGPDGKPHVKDPYFGVRAMAKSDLLWWGGFGVVYGALVGAAGGGGLFGVIEEGVVSAVVWGIVGLGVGALYGALFGQAFSGRRLKGVGPLVGPGTSILAAWVDGASPLTKSALDEYAKPGSQRLVLNFNPSERGVVLQAV
jgi:hypothetical protein